MLAPEEPILEVQKEYWKYWNSRSDYPHDRAQRRGDKILAYLRSLHLDRPTILDMGCGMGWFANRLAQFGPTMGIDLSDDAISRAKSEFPQVAFVAGNVLEMDLPERNFDVVVSQEVIAHVPDQRGYVERAARVLKPDGYLILTTPNRFIHERVEWPAQPPGHIERWLSRGALKRLLRSQFRILRTTTAVPIGDRGILRLVNSRKLNWILEFLFLPGRVNAFKEWAGFGWTLVVLARKNKS